MKPIAGWLMLAGLLSFAWPAEEAGAEKQECAPAQVADATRDELRERLKYARRFIPDGEPETYWVSPSHRISRQRFRVLDGKGNWFTVSTSCSGQCTGWNGTECELSGCQVDGRTCTPLTCTGGDCTSRCMKVSTE